MDNRERSVRLMHLALLLIFVAMLLAVLLLANLLGLWVYFVVLLLLIWVTIGEHSLLKVRYLDLRRQKDDPQYRRIVQISDFHLNKMALKPIIKRLNSLGLDDRDCVVLTGDIFDVDKKDQLPAVELIMAINKLSCRKFLIWGNHEKDREGFEEFAKIIDQTSIEAIGGKTVVFGDTLISGLDYGQEQYEVNIENLPNRRFRNLWTREVFSAEQEIKHRVLIAHGFKQTKEACELGNYTLALCGHEHGGQVRLPLLGAILPAQAISLRAIFPELRGHLTRGNHLIAGTRVHICSGCGSSLVPVRFLNQAQISVIDIN